MFQVRTVINTVSNQSPKAVNKELNMSLNWLLNSILCKSHLSLSWKQDRAADEQAKERYNRKAFKDIKRQPRLGPIHSDSTSLPSRFPTLQGNRSAAANVVQLYSRQPGHPRKANTGTVSQVQSLS